MDLDESSSEEEKEGDISQQIVRERELEMKEHEKNKEKEKRQENEKTPWARERLKSADQDPLSNPNPNPNKQPQQTHTDPNNKPKTTTPTATTGTATSSNDSNNSRREEKKGRSSGGSSRKERQKNKEKEVGSGLFVGLCSASSSDEENDGTRDIIKHRKKGSRRNKSQPHSSPQQQPHQSPLRKKRSKDGSHSQKTATRKKESGGFSSKMVNSCDSLTSPKTSGSDLIKPKDETRRKKREENKHKIKEIFDSAEREASGESEKKTEKPKDNNEKAKENEKEPEKAKENEKGKEKESSRDNDKNKYSEKTKGKKRRSGKGSERHKSVDSCDGDSLSREFSKELLKKKSADSLDKDEPRKRRKDERRSKIKQSPNDDDEETSDEGGVIKEVNADEWECLVSGFSNGAQTPDDEFEDESYTIALLGGGGVGKSSLVIRFLHNDFDDTEVYDPTLTEEYHARLRVINKFCHVTFIDTAGQEQYAIQRQDVVRSSDAYIVVFDVTQRMTLEEADGFVSEICRVKLKDSDQLPILVLANKIECSPEDRQISSEEGKLFAESNQVAFAEVSAATGVGVRDALSLLLQKLSIPGREGVLFKISKTLNYVKSPWQKRHLILDTKYLKYYKNRKDLENKKPSGTILLSEVQRVMKPETRQTNVLCITTEKKTYYFKADSLPERNDWVRVLKRHVNAQRKREPPPTSGSSREPTNNEHKNKNKNKNKDENKNKSKEEENSKKKSKLKIKVQRVELNEENTEKDSRRSASARNNRQHMTPQKKRRKRSRSQSPQRHKSPPTPDDSATSKKNNKRFNTPKQSTKFNKSNTFDSRDLGLLRNHKKKLKEEELLSEMQTYKHSKAGRTSSGKLTESGGRSGGSKPLPSYKGSRKHPKRRVGHPKYHSYNLSLRGRKTMPTDDDKGRRQLGDLFP